MSCRPFSILACALRHLLRPTDVSFSLTVVLSSYPGSSSQFWDRAFCSLYCAFLDSWSQLPHVGKRLPRVSVAPARFVRRAIRTFSECSFLTLEHPSPLIEALSLLTSELHYTRPWPASLLLSDYPELSRTCLAVGRAFCYPRILMPYIRIALS